MKKRSNFFYDSFVKQIEFAVNSINALKEGLINFKDTNLLDLKNKVHTIEHNADIAKHEYEERLAKEFFTPIDREDIFMLYDNIDDLIDAIDEISYKLYLRNYKELPIDTNLFLDKSIDAINYLKDVLVNFINIDNKKIMDPLINKVIETEEEVDRLYEEYVHRLYVNETDYRKTTSFEKIYGYFEYLTDKCRDVCKTIKIIMYKNL